jgi:hypothetical protein
MSWKFLSLHFKQTYEGGFRYLDKCGEFMLIAEKKWGFISGDAQPIGAKMELPERGIHLNCDAKNLVASQELPPEGDLFFPEICQNTTSLYKELFSPTSVLKNGFALKCYISFSNPQDLLAASLKIGKDSQNEVSKIVGMISEQKKLDYTFVSGSKELRVALQPVTFNGTSLTRQNSNAQHNKVEKIAIERRNTFADHIAKNFSASHALVLEMDLMESDPPADSNLVKHFSDLVQKYESLTKTFFKL